MKIILTILIPYLIGGFSPAYFLGRMTKDIDIRNYGSGNAGTTNAMRVFGKKIGVLTFLIDMLKGVLAVIIGRYLMESGGYVAAIFVVLGHNWPVFLNFKGGKGVATSFGVLIILNWKMAIICLVIWICVIFFTKYVSLGSIMAVISAPIVSFILIGSVWDYLFLTTLMLAVLSIFRHRKNISRLLSGNENKLGNKDTNKNG